MTVVLALFAVLVVTGILVPVCLSLVGRETWEWLPYLSRALVRGAAFKLRDPERWEGEWLGDLEAIGQRRIYGFFWALDIRLRAARGLSRQEHSSVDAIPTGGWLAGLFQFAGGAALAIGILGIARGGRDLWLGIALIVIAALFGLRSVAFDEERREQERKRLLDDFTREIVAQLPDPNLGGSER